MDKDYRSPGMSTAGPGLSLAFIKIVNDNLFCVNRTIIYNVCEKSSHTKELETRFTVKVKVRPASEPVLTEHIT